MKRYLYILCFCLGSFFMVPSLLSAQDLQRFTENHIIGSARYVGMGGAMTAIGGDPTAVLDNPAGLGMYRRSEVALTIDETINRTQQVGSTDTYQRARFAVPKVSFIWALGNAKKQHGLIYTNLMFSINRVANYNRDVVVTGKDLGMVKTMCMNTNGLTEESLKGAPWDDAEIGWLSILGYEGYLINPMVNSSAINVVDKYQWTPAVDFTDGSLSVSETGYNDQYTISWANNINNQWYVGLNLNIPTLKYTKRVTLYETNRINSAELQSLYYATGVGVGGSIGVIYRPMQYLRIGAAFHTPAWMGLSVQTEGKINSSLASPLEDIYTPESGVMRVDILTPLRSSVSVAGQIGPYAMLAAQYDYAHSVEMNDVHTLRLGLEAQVCPRLYLNAGYVYESSFLQEDPIVGLDITSVRTDTDYRFTDHSQYASAGIGYRSDHVMAHLAYQYRWQTLHQYATEWQLQPLLVHTNTHHIVFTIAWRFQ